MRKSGNGKFNPPHSFRGKETGTVVRVVAVDLANYEAVWSSSGIVPQAALLLLWICTSCSIFSLLMKPRKALTTQKCKSSFLLGFTSWTPFNSTCFVKLQAKIARVAGINSSLFGNRRNKLSLLNIDSSNVVRLVYIMTKIQRAAMYA